MVQSPKHETTPDLQLQALREKWGPSWYVWRSYRSGDDPEGTPTGSFVATLMEPAAGIDATVMQSTPEQLSAALERQAALAGDGRTLPSLGPLRPPA